jgi:hypothetical protein
MATRMQQRRGTAAQWISLNDGDGPILASGEIGFESDTNQFKIGDGITHWNELSYFKNLDDLGGSLDDYIPVTSKGAASGVAELDATFNVLTKTGVVFEGATANDFETTLQVTEPTADRAITLPNATGTVLLADGSGNVAISGNLAVSGTTTTIDSTVINIQNEIKFEGITPNDFETSLVATDPTADRTVTLPDLTGTVILDAGAQTLYTKSINLNSNILNGTTAEFNAALSDSNFATTTGTETLTNKTLTSPNINEAVALTATATELNILDGATLSVTELNYVDGVTSAIQTQIDAKAPLASPTFTGTVTLPSGAVTSTMILDGTILNEDINATAAIDWTKLGISSTVSSTEIGYVDGVTSAIQTQLDAKAPLASPTFTGTVSGVTKDHVGLGNVDNIADLSKPISTATQTALDAKLASATAATTYETITNVALKASLAGPTFTGTVTLPSTTSIGDVSSTELGYVNGVTASIQTQLDGKQATVANVSDVEIGYLDGVTSSIQTQLGNKQAVVANVSDTEIGYLDGVTSAIQTQLDAKLASATASSTYAPLASPALTGTPTATLAVTGTNTTQIATTSFVQQELSVLTAGAPGALNTLDELAAALGDDANYAATITTALGNKAPLASPTFTGTVTLPAAGIVFTDGTQALEGVPSRTPIIQKTASYTLSLLTERDDLIEMGSASAITLTIPTDATLDFPVGTSIDILQTGAGQVTIAPVSGTVTVNPLPKKYSKGIGCVIPIGKLVTKNPSPL